MASELNLMLHCGGRSVDRDELHKSITPKATKSHHPIAHTLLLDSVTRSLAKYGMQVVSEAHGLQRNGDRYFGLIQAAPLVADSINTDYAFVIGLRNSHDKKFPAGLCIGNGVFVCDNLSFTGELVLARKHTRRVKNDLPALIERTLREMRHRREDQDKRIAAYKRTDVSDKQAHDIVIRAMDEQAISSMYIPRVLKQWRDPAHPEFKERNAWSLFNGFTQAFKDRKANAAYSYEATTKLHSLFSRVVNKQVAV